MGLRKINALKGGMAREFGKLNLSSI